MASVKVQEALLGWCNNKVCVEVVGPINRDALIVDVFLGDMIGLFSAESIIIVAIIVMDHDSLVVLSDADALIPFLKFSLPPEIFFSFG